MPIKHEGAPPFEDDEERPSLESPPLHETGPGLPPWEPDLFTKDLADAEADAYDEDDPKHPTWRERLAAIWDSRPGK